MRLTVLALVLIAASSGAWADDDDWCGEVIENGPYELRVGSLDVHFPVFLEITVNGRTVFSDVDKQIWAFPYNGLLVAETDAYVLVEAFEQDCVDLLNRRIYVLSKAGDLLVSSNIRTSNWEDAFYVDGDDLVYWSEWFCHPENTKRLPKSSYVYVWSGAGVFREENRAYGLSCSDEAIDDIRRDRIDFEPLEPSVGRSASDG